MNITLKSISDYNDVTGCMNMINSTAFQSIECLPIII